MQKEEYDVLVDTNINDEVCRKGRKVNLTERQAKYHVLAKKIVLSKKTTGKPDETKPTTTKNKSDKGAK